MSDISDDIYASLMLLYLCSLLAQKDHPASRDIIWHYADYLAMKCVFRSESSHPILLFWGDLTEHNTPCLGGPDRTLAVLSCDIFMARVRVKRTWSIPITKT